MFFVNRYVQFCKIRKKVIFLSSTSHATPHSGSAIKVQFLVLDSQSISKKSHRLAAKVWREKSCASLSALRSFYPHKPQWS